MGLVAIVVILVNDFLYSFLVITWVISGLMVTVGKGFLVRVCWVGVWFRLFCVLRFWVLVIVLWFAFSIGILVGLVVLVGFAGFD